MSLNATSDAATELFVQTETLNCVLKGCIPCLYKLYPKGCYEKDCSNKELDTIKFPPNQRPEMCPRAKVPKFTGLYNSAQSIMTVGDGDFSFSLSIAEHFYKINKHFKMTVTSHESYESVLTTYPTCAANLKRLKHLGAQVFHDVDATSLATTLPLINVQYDVIIWNFPCVRITAGADGQTNELEINRNLLRTFFDNAHPYLTARTGEVHVTHKTIEPFSWWGIVTLAAENSMDCEGSVIFDKYNYPGYINRKVLDKKSFPSNDAQTYIFTSNRNSNAAAAKYATGSNKAATPMQKTLHNENLVVSMADATVKANIRNYMTELQIKFPQPAVSATTATSAKNASFTKTNKSSTSIKLESGVVVDTGGCNGGIVRANHNIRSNGENKRKVAPALRAKAKGTVSLSKTVPGKKTKFN